MGDDCITILHLALSTNSACLNQLNTLAEFLDKEENPTVTVLEIFQVLGNEHVADATSALEIERTNQQFCPHID